MRRQAALEYIRSGEAAEDLAKTNNEPQRFSLVVGRLQLPNTFDQEMFPHDDCWCVLAVDNTSIKEGANEDMAQAYFMRPRDRGNYGNVHQGHNHHAYGHVNNLWLWDTD